MSLIKNISLKDTSGQSHNYDIGADATNVAYDSNTSIKSKVDTILSNLNTHDETSLCSEDGIHGIRYYEGELEVWIEEDLEWVSVNSGTSEFPIGDVIGATATTNKSTATLTWSDPEDLVIAGVTIAAWAGTTVVRKAGSAPTSVRDGIQVLDNTTRNQYSTNGYVDTGLTYGTTYYYRFFPYKMIGSNKSYTDGSSVAITPARTIISTIPSQSGSLTYNGDAQSPSWSNYDSDELTLSGDTEGTNADSYTAVFTPKSDYCWSDGTQTGENVSWSIGKATGGVTLTYNGNTITSSTNISLNSSGSTATVSIANATGTVSASSASSGIATTSISGNTLTITCGSTNGSTNITVNVAASSNYNAYSITFTFTANLAQLVSWSSGTDAQIKAMVDAYYAGTFTLAQVKSVWSVGDSRSISLSAMSATGVGESHRAQTVEMIILDFDHDTLTTAINGKTKALVTVEMKNCLRDASVTDTTGSSNTENGYMNSSNTNVNGWRGCARRTWCNEVFYNALPSGFKVLVKQANHQTTVGNQGTSLETTADYAFLPSEWEVFGAKTYAAAQEGTQYAYYATAANRYKLPKWSSSDVSDNWWERSPYGSNATSFCRVRYSGGASAGIASGAFGVAPAVCI